MGGGVAVAVRYGGAVWDGAHDVCLCHRTWCVLLRKRSMRTSVFERVPLHDDNTRVRVLFLVNGLVV